MQQDHQRVIPKTQKMVLDTSLRNTQNYTVRINSKWWNSRKGIASSPTPPCNDYRNGNLRISLDYGRQVYLLDLIVDLSASRTSAA